MATRVLVVEDSITVRKWLVQVLSLDLDVEVVGEATNGAQAVELCRSLRPDVITLDMQLPEMSGLTATEHIMASCPTPIVIVSAASNRGELFSTYDALAAGAVDVLEKPTVDQQDDVWARKLLSKVKVASRIKVITHLRPRRSPRLEARTAPSGTLPGTPKGPRLVAIGASTGGPGAIVQVLKGLPGNFALPILFVLHIGAGFGQSLAEWLDRLSPIRVTGAVHGEPLPEPGNPRVILATPDHHLVLEGDRLCLTTAPERNYCRPSIDVLFESIARTPDLRAIACLLTGMGKDGAAGLLAIRQAGGSTIAQDEASSVVYGMPREAILIGAAQRVVPLDGMAAAITRLAAGPSKVECVT